MLDLHTELLILSCAFPQLRKLSISFPVLQLFCNSAAPEFRAWLNGMEEAPVAIRTLLLRIQELVIEELDETHFISSFLQVVGSQITSLTFSRCDLEAMSAAREQKLRDGLGSLVNIRSFSIDRSVGLADILNQTSSGPIWRLRSLSLTFMTELTPAEVDMIAYYKDTLEDLTVATDEDQQDYEPEAPLFSSPFLRLRTLQITGTTARYLLTHTSTTPNLRNLTIIGEYHVGHELIFEPFREYLSRISSLRTLDISVNPISPAHLCNSQETFDILQRLGTLVNVNHVFRTPFDPFLPSPNDEVYMSEDPTSVGAARYVRRRVEPVKETLEFARCHLEGLVRTNDIGGMLRLMDALRPLRMLKYFQED